MFPNRSDSHMLETSRLILRPWTMPDLQSFHAICQKSEVMKYIDNPWNSERVREFIRNEQQQFKQLGHCRWALELKTLNRLIGFCGFRPLQDDDRQLEIGWRLDSDYWQQGLGFEAAELVINDALQNLSPTRLFAKIHVHNQASLALAKKLGFEITKRIPVAEFDDFLLDYPLIANQEIKSC